MSKQNETKTTTPAQDEKAALLAALNQQIDQMRTLAMDLENAIDHALWTHAKPMLDQGYETREDQITAVKMVGLFGDALGKSREVRQRLQDIGIVLVGL